MTNGTTKDLIDSSYFLLIKCLEAMARDRLTLLMSRLSAAESHGTASASVQVNSLGYLKSSLGARFGGTGLQKYTDSQALIHMVLVPQKVSMDVSLLEQGLENQSESLQKFVAPFSGLLLSHMPQSMAVWKGELAWKIQTVYRAVVLEEWYIKEY